ncbi:hypothetical protein ACFFK7_10675 [Pseudoalteromonas xiamenensis]|uniref:hypothetical protein n=1 Tax=Pseudoalteromonas xiamenensis TaxID=882626 RepID=UPI0035EB8E2D
MSLPLLLTFAINLSAHVSHSDMAHFKELVYTSPSEAMMEYERLVKRIDENESEGAIAIHRLALIAAYRANRLEDIPKITQAMTDAKFDELNGEIKANALLALGGIYIYNEQLEQTLWHYECAKRLDPSPENAIKLNVNTVIVYIKQKKFSEALALLDSIDESKIGSRGKGVKRMLEGNILFFESRYAEAIKAYQRSLSFYQSEEDMTGAIKVKHNILFAALLSSDWITYDRFYNALHGDIIENVELFGRNWIDLMHVSAQFQRQRITQTQFEKAFLDITAVMEADYQDEVAELIERLHLSIKPSVSNKTQFQLPVQLGKRWCSPSN